MDRLFHNRVRKIVQERSPDPETWRDNPLGVPYDEIQEKILKWGRTDFSEDYHGPEDFAPVSADDRVLLYCYLNLRRHFWENYVNFRAEQREIRDAFRCPKVIIIDIGCGPGTAGLAFGELFRCQRFFYCGIDSSPSMRSKAAELFRTAIDTRCLHPQTKFRFSSNWGQLPDHAPTNSTMIFNFSFFFASHSLSNSVVDDLAAKVYDIVTLSESARFFIGYTNTTNVELSGYYFRFLRRLGFSETAPEVCDSLVNERVQYFQTRRSQTPKEITFVRQLYEIFTE